jgi:charged multivesicular body protein 2A
MGNVFAPEKPLKDIVRENQRMIKKSIRELEKEIRSLETNEKKLIADIKKNAKLNQMVLVCLMNFLKTYHIHLIAEFCENHGKRFGQDAQLHHKIY